MTGWKLHIFYITMLRLRFWGCLIPLSYSSCLVLLAVAQVTNPSGVDALLAVKSSLIDYREHLRNWNKGDPCNSSWTGVLCFGSFGTDGYLHIRELQLLIMNLSGTLAPEIGKLSQLVILFHTEANPPIFHRDIKSTNILLDSNYTAKVADFELSRLAPVQNDEGTCPRYVSTDVRGTPGYLDPEYFLTNKLTDKSDVYSLGIVFLELLTGFLPISHGKNIVHESGLIFSIIDSRMGSYPSECVEKFVALALRCCHDKQDDRPSMLDVVRELETIIKIMPVADTRFSPFASSYA